MIETGLYLPPDPTTLDRRHRLLLIHDERIDRILRELVGDRARIERLYYGVDSSLELRSRLRSPGAAAAPWLFWETFESLGDETFLDISEAGVCRLIASVILDHLADDQFPHPAPATELVEALTERAAALFAGLFPTNSSFWSHYERLTTEHHSALATELRCRADPERFSYAALEETSSGKVCPGVITVVAMSIASGREAILSPIEDSLKHAAIAFQLVDDIHDWRSDLEAGHLTFFLAGLAHPEVWKRANWRPAEEVERWVLSERREVKSLRYALASIREATAAVHAVYCPEWTNYVHSKRLEVDHMLGRVLARAIAGIGPSVRRGAAARPAPLQEKYVMDDAAVGSSESGRSWSSAAGAAIIDDGAAAARLEAETTRKPPRLRSVRRSCQHALDALLAAQRYDGSWIDFDLGDAGGTDTWVTAHIGLQLATLRGWETAVRRTQALERASSYLLTKWRHGWAYNDLAPVDADSTAQAVLFLHAIGTWIPPATSKALAVHQQPDGGFATYLRGRAEKIPENWCRSHPDVTPVVIQALSVIGGDCAESKAVRLALGRITADRDGERPWPAFWWNLRWYTAAAWSRVLMAMGSECGEFRWPSDLSLVLEDDCWLDAALLLEVALNCGSNQLAGEIVEQLLASQLDSGLWPIRPVLRQPPAGDDRPWEGESSDELYADIHGLYSTATILNRLAMYEKSIDAS